MIKLTRIGSTRMCHVITTPTDQYSSGLRMRMQAKLAQDLGFSVDIITGLGPRDGRLISQGIDGVTYRRFPALTKYIRPHLDFGALFQLYTLFRRQRYRIVHTHLAKAGILGRLAAGLAGVPIIVHDVHGPTFTDFHSPARRALYVNLERLAGRATTHYVFYTHHLKESFAAEGIGRNAQKYVTYPDLHLQRFLDSPPLSMEARSRLRSTWGLTPENLVIGYVARMVPSKGHHLAIEAFSRLKDRWPQARLLLVGGAIWPEERAYYTGLHERAKILRVDDKVIFAGHQVQIIPFYQMMDIFTMPSFYEGTANAMIEALVMGLPVVAFDIPAVHEFCPSEVTTCPFGDSAGLAGGLDRCLSQLLSNAEPIGPSMDFRRSLVSKFSAETWHESIERFYRSLNSPG
jgi:glycosyltransferase involved in cell wall biosynthesis